jgi:hypothetical protein
MSALALFLSLLTNPVSAQLYFKLQWLPDSLAWGVFVKPEEGLDPGDYLMVGSGQVTVVSPAGFGFRNLKCFSGQWTQNAYVNAPEENPAKDYVSFGLDFNNPAIVLQEGEETLLFTFQKREEDCPEALYLIDNNDPFNNLPNSVNSNPGNDLSILDPSKDKAIYYFSANYAKDAWNCDPAKHIPQGHYIQGDWRRMRKREAIKP